MVYPEHNAAIQRFCCLNVLICCIRLPDIFIIIDCRLYICYISNSCYKRLIPMAGSLMRRPHKEERTSRMRMRLS